MSDPAATCQDVTGLWCVPAYRTCGCIYNDGQMIVPCAVAALELAETARIIESLKQKLAP